MAETINNGTTPNNAPNKRGSRKTRVGLVVSDKGKVVLTFFTEQ